MGVVGLIIGLVGGWFIGHRTAGTSGSYSSSTAMLVDYKNGSVVAQGQNSASAGALSVNSAPSEESNSAILVMDQGAGSVATVASVETDVPVWVVIREDKNGVVGNILGATRVDAGASNNIVITLLRSTVAGQTYRVVLFKDDGDKKFDHAIDIPLTSGGVLISKAFKTFVQ